MDFLKTYQLRINQHLESLLSSRQGVNSSGLQQAMYYAVMPGGKRIRPLFTYATGFCFSDDPSKMDNVALAVELMHCYSLVHDDLPCMDNDDFRRGKPTCHKAFNEATAILAADALQCLAFEILARENNPRLITLLAHACGYWGMIEGQYLDLEAKITPPSPKGMETISRLKTGALFSAALELAALSGGCKDGWTLSRLRELGELIGLLFQYRDDLDDEPTRTKELQLLNIKNVDFLFKKVDQLVNELEGDTAFLKWMVNFIKSSFQPVSS